MAQSPAFSRPRLLTTGHWCHTSHHDTLTAPRSTIQQCRTAQSSSTVLPRGTVPSLSASGMNSERHRGLPLLRRRLASRQEMPQSAVGRPRKVTTRD